MPTALNIGLLHKQRLSSGHPDLLFDDVDARGQLGDGVFDLKTGVHLDEIKSAVFVEKFECAHAAVPDVQTGLYATFANSLQVCVWDVRGRCFFNHFLVPSLQRAVSGAQPDGMAVLIRQDLDFDMPWMQQEFLNVDLGVPEGVGGLFAGQRQSGCQLMWLVDNAHAATPTTTGSFHNDRGTHVVRNSLYEVGILGQRGVWPGHTGHTRQTHGPFGGDFVTHLPNAGSAGADEVQAGLLYLFHEFRVLGQKAVTWVNRLCARYFGCSKNGRLLQVALLRSCGSYAQGLVCQLKV